MDGRMARTGKERDVVRKENLCYFTQPSGSVVSSGSIYYNKIP